MAHHRHPPDTRIRPSNGRLLRRTPEPARTPRAALVSGGQGRRPREARQAAEAIVAAVTGGSIGMLAALVLGAAAVVVARLLWAWLGGPR